MVNEILSHCWGARCKDRGQGGLAGEGERDEVMKKKRAVIENMYVTKYLPLRQTWHEWEKQPVQADIFHVFVLEKLCNMYLPNIANVPKFFPILLHLIK